MTEFEKWGSITVSHVYSCIWSLFISKASAHLANLYLLIHFYVLIFHLFRLAIIDSLLILNSLIQKTIIPYFTSLSPLEPVWFRVMYPYFWYPIKEILVTITIYLVVAISAEKFRALCYPHSKRHVSFFCKL